MKRLLWRAFQWLLLAVHGTVGAWWRRNLRRSSPSVRHHIRLLRTARYVHRIDSLGTRVAFGDGVRIEGPVQIHLADRSAVLEGAILNGTGVIRVGAGSSIGHECVIVAREAVTIGANCMLAGRCYVLDVDHEFADPSTPITQQDLRVEPVTIGDDVWLGACTVVLRGVSIGDGCVVGANSVVTHDLPAWTIAAGAPAKVVAQRA
jgi:acetyltransferase-like isoleucine patch superfamily enzyme